MTAQCKGVMPKSSRALGLACLGEKAQFHHGFLAVICRHVQRGHADQLLATGGGRVVLENILNGVQGTELEATDIAAVLSSSSPRARVVESAQQLR